MRNTDEEYRLDPHYGSTDCHRLLIRTLIENRAGKDVGVVEISLDREVAEIPLSVMRKIMEQLNYALDGEV